MREFASSRVHQEWCKALLAHWLELEHVIPSTCKEGREICQLSRKRKWAFLNTFNGQSELQLMSLLRKAASFLEPCLQGSGGILDGKALLNSCALESLIVMWPPPSFPFKPAFGFQVQTHGRKNEVGHVLPWKSSTANARFQREVGDADLTFS